MEGYGGAGLLHSRVVLLIARAASSPKGRPFGDDAAPARGDPGPKRRALKSSFQNCKSRLPIVQSKRDMAI